MSFEVAASAYARFMGVYADRLAPLFADLADVAHGQRALDVGCGPGALTAVLVERLGEDQVAGIDPSPPFVAAAAGRFPEADVRQGAAESLPWPGAAFDRTLAQLVVQFMADPPAGVGEMVRVTAPGGMVAACVWDHGGGRGPLSPFWRAATPVVPTQGEARQVGVHADDLAALLDRTGLEEVAETDLAVTVPYTSFEEWWEPYTFGVGPAGGFVAALDDATRSALRASCRDLLGEGPFEVTAHAWAATGVVPT